MQSSREIPPSGSPNPQIGFFEVISWARGLNACMKPNCTTCGAMPFRLD